MKKILFINHKQQQCGVYQYGLRSFNIIKKSATYEFIYKEVESENEFLQLTELKESSGVIYNYHPATLPWLNERVMKGLPYLTHYGIHHEGNISVPFNYHILSDCTKEDYGTTFSVPRPLIEGFSHETFNHPIPFIGSFGFGFHNKGFERLVNLVNEKFEKSVIRLHIPFAHYGDMDGRTAMHINKLCHDHIDESRTKLLISHHFMTDEQLLEFLSMNTVNCFLYDEMKGRGLSSAIDYALSVNIPIAISNSDMFRHINLPSICIENNSLRKIIDNGTEPLQPFKEKWSHKNFIDKYQYILNQTL